MRTIPLTLLSDQPVLVINMFRPLTYHIHQPLRVIELWLFSVTACYRNVTFNQSLKLLANHSFFCDILYKVFIWPPGPKKEQLPYH